MKRVLSTYQQAKNEEFKGHPLLDLICREIKDTLFKVVDLDPNIYHVAGSVGKGRWAEIPWISIFLKNLTTSATRGYYIVYLFSADGSGVYVSLNQGWTYFKEKYGTKIGRAKIQKTASIIREKLNTIPQNMNLSNIDLKGKGDLARGYELGHVCGCFYGVSNFPSSEDIINDLQALLVSYIQRSRRSYRKSIDRTV